MVAVPLRRMPNRRKQKGFGDHDKFLERVTKTLHYGKYPSCDRTSLPVTELAAQIFSRAKGKLSLEFLDIEEAARISRNASISPCSLVLALLYLDRLKSSNPKYLAKVPPSQLFLISLMVGSKFLQDDGQDDEVNNCEWATYAGLTIQDINRAEREFLNAIKWEVYVSKEEFWRRLKSVEEIVGLREGSKRGWFSYTELEMLLHFCQLSALAKTIANISFVCLASYTASVLALIGSTALVSRVPGIIPSPNAPVTNLPLPTQLSEPVSSADMRISLDTLRLNQTDDEMDIPAELVLEPKSCFDIQTGWNFSESCDMETHSDEVVAWDGLDLYALWQNFELKDPATSWAGSLRRILVRDSMLIAVGGSY